MWQRSSEHGNAMANQSIHDLNLLFVKHHSKMSIKISITYVNIVCWVGPTLGRPYVGKAQHWVGPLPLQGGRRLGGGMSFAGIEIRYVRVLCKCVCDADPEDGTLLRAESGCLRVK